MKRIAVLLCLLWPSTAWATAYTTTTAGNWSNTATWGGTGPPTANDTVTITKAVTVDVNTSVGLTAFTTGGTAAVLISTGGSLTINSGVTLTLSGDLKHAADSIVTLNAGSTLNFATPSGQQAVWAFAGGGNYNAYLVANGTSGSHCTIETTSGTNTLMTIGQYRNMGVITASYTDFSNFGTSAAYGIAVLTDYTNNANVSITNCTFTACNGKLTLGANNTWDGNLTWTGNVFSSSVSTSISGVACCLNVACGQAPTSGTRQFTGSTWDLNLLCTQAGEQFSQCLFLGGVYTAGTLKKPWGQFDSCLYVQNSSVATGKVSATTVSNCYFLDTTSTHPVGFGINDVAANTAVTACLFDAPSNAGTGHIVGCPPYAGTFTCTFTNNIGLPSYGANVTPGCMTAPALTSSSGLKVVAEHNTWCVGTAQGGLLECGNYNSVVASAGRIQSVRSNIVWATSAGGSQGAVVAYNSTTTTQDEVTVAGYNCFQNPTSGTWNIAGVDTATVGYLNGLTIKEKVTSASQVGVGDIVLANGPHFVDATRDLANWGVYQGLALAGDTWSTKFNNTVAYLTSHPSMIPSMCFWVRQGFEVQHLSLRAASYSGDLASTDANGNPWPGGVPGIGAMRWRPYSPSAARPRPFNVLEQLGRAKLPLQIRFRGAA